MNSVAKTPHVNLQSLQEIVNQQNDKVTTVRS